MVKFIFKLLVITPIILIGCKSANIVDYKNLKDRKLPINISFKDSIVKWNFVYDSKEFVINNPRTKEIKINDEKIIDYLYFNCFKYGTKGKTYYIGDLKINNNYKSSLVASYKDYEDSLSKSYSLYLINYNDSFLLSSCELSFYLDSEWGRIVIFTKINNCGVFKMKAHLGSDAIQPFQLFEIFNSKYIKQKFKVDNQGNITIIR